MDRGAEFANNPIRLSPMVGHAGDYDGDTIAAVFGGPHIQKQLHRDFLDPTSRGLYEEFSIRSQLLKAKAAQAGGANIADMASGAVYKLGVTKTGQLGALSNEIQMYRAAALSDVDKFTATERADVLHLMEWMEQTPISAKHIAAGQEEKVVTLLDQIHASLASKKASGLQGALGQIMNTETAKQSGLGAMNEGVTAFLDLQGKGQVEALPIRGLSASSAIENAVKMRNIFEKTAAGSTTASRLRELMLEKGRGIRAEEALGLVKPGTIGGSTFGSMFSEAGMASEGTLAGLARGASERIGAAQRLGARILPHMKPLAIGGGIAVGLSLLLSEPPKVLGPGATVPPRASMGSGSGGSSIPPENVNQESRVSGSPTVSDVTRSGNTARVASGYDVNVRSNSRSNLDYGSMNTQMRRAVGGRGRVNSFVRDDRSSLTPQKLSSILRGR